MSEKNDPLVIRSLKSCNKMKSNISLNRWLQRPWNLAGGVFYDKGLLHKNSHDSLVMLSCEVMGQMKKDGGGGLW